MNSTNNQSSDQSVDCDGKMPIIVIHKGSDESRDKRKKSNALKKKNNEAMNKLKLCKIISVCIIVISIVVGACFLGYHCYHSRADRNDIESNDNSQRALMTMMSVDSPKEKVDEKQKAPEEEPPHSQVASASEQLKDGKATVLYLGMENDVSSVFHWVKDVDVIYNMQRKEPDSAMQRAWLEAMGPTWCWGGNEEQQKTIIRALKNEWTDHIKMPKSASDVGEWKITHAGSSHERWELDFTYEGKERKIISFVDWDFNTDWPDEIRNISHCLIIGCPVPTELDTLKKRSTEELCIVWNSGHPDAASRFEDFSDFQEIPEKSEEIEMDIAPANHKSDKTPDPSSFTKTSFTKKSYRVQK